MKTNHFLSSLCLAPLALAAPLSHTVTLVAGKAVFRQNHQITTLFQEVQHVLVSKKSPSSSSTSSHTIEESSPSILLDAERPLTTAELLALSHPEPPTQPAPSQQTKSHRPKAAKAGNKKISVGALVVPSAPRTGVLSKILDSHTSPYLIPGQYVSSQRADVLIVGMILACVLVVVAMESWELICSLATRSTSMMREGSIRLDSPTDLEQGESDDDDDDDDDDCDTPFGGFPKSARQDKGLRLPEKLDEKTNWI